MCKPRVKVNQGPNETLSNKRNEIISFGRVKMFSTLMCQNKYLVQILSQIFLQAFWMTFSPAVNPIKLFFCNYNNYRIDYCSNWFTKICRCYLRYIGTAKPNTFLLI